jgi:predicted amidohydrolase YtcJ
VIDAEGRTVTPGLIDAHMHLLLGGESLRMLDLRGVRSRQEFESAIAARHRELPPGRWLIAQGWAAEYWPPEEGLPDRTWLAAVGDRHVVCYRMDLHAGVVNDAVLAKCDVTNDPPGGRIGRDANGEPTGLMVEAALWTLVNPLVPEPDAEEKMQVLLDAQQHCHAMGLTAVGTFEYQRDVREVFVPMRDQLTLRCRVSLLDRAWPMDFAFGREFPNDDHLAVIGYKAFADGTLGSRTARMLADYADDPGNRGMLVELAAEGHLQAWAHAVAADGLSPAIHAIGDEAVRLALDALEDIEHGRIEHSQQIDLADIPRFHDGPIASMQPLHKADDGRYAEARLGPARIKGSFPFRQLLDAGATLAFGSDWPVVSCDPLAGIRAAVTGLTLDGNVVLPEENLTVEEALMAYTSGAAIALRMDNVGVLRPGAFADVVMFDRDPFTADWVNDPPRVAMTLAGGEIVYDNEQSVQAPHASR